VLAHWPFGRSCGLLAVLPPTLPKGTSSSWTNNLDCFSIERDGKKKNKKNKII